MESPQIVAKLKEIVRLYVEDKDTLQNLNEKTDFLRELKINSANLVDIVLDIEESFGIVIDNDEMERMLSIDAATVIIKAKLAAK